MLCDFVVYVWCGVGGWVGVGSGVYMGSVGGVGVPVRGCVVAHIYVLCVCVCIYIYG